MSKSKQFVVLILVCNWISACSVQTLPLQTIYSSNNCAVEQQTLRPVKSAAELDQLLESFPKKFSSAAAINQQINYHKQSLIFFALGQKPNSGYRIEVDGNEALIKGQDLYLPVRIQIPDESDFHAQIITSPCRIYSIPKTDFKQIHLSAK